jgi:hypothetical protein
LFSLGSWQIRPAGSRESDRKNEGENMKVQVRFLFFVAVLQAITLPAFSREVKTDSTAHKNR